ncbi:subclass B3 metallo-beta-lactamase [Acidobacteria bacterium AB60]|nr:subclass B3 metallo-beta-lactamase [Acidobacteria bacterium AB60]
MQPRRRTFFLMFAFTITAGGVTVAQESPRSAIELYFKAHAFGNSDYINQAFSPDARISFIQQGQAASWTREEFAQRFQQPAPDEYSRVRRIEELHVSGDAASAVVTLNYPQVLFTDHLSLLRIGDQWKIVNKVFHADHRDRAKAAIDNTLQDWSKPFEPRRIVGNIYYVGSNMISSFLIATPQGAILLDTGTAQMLPQVERNIERLGFHPADVKLLLNTHAHFDHCGGFAAFKRQTGAAVVASQLDGELMQRGGKGDFYWGDELAYEPVKPDRSVKDGDTVELGGVTLTAHLTPGHTKGCTSWSMQTIEGGRPYNVLFLCGLTVSPYKLTNNDRYPNIVNDARSSLKKLQQMHVDVLLASHAFWFDLENKAARQTDGGPNPFVDPAELGRHLSEMSQDLEQALEAQERQR